MKRHNIAMRLISVALSAVLLSTMVNTSVYGTDNSNVSYEDTAENQGGGGAGTPSELSEGLKDSTDVTASNNTDNSSQNTSNDSNNSNINVENISDNSNMNSSDNSEGLPQIIEETEDTDNNSDDAKNESNTDVDVDDNKEPEMDTSNNDDNENLEEELEESLEVPKHKMLMGALGNSNGSSADFNYNVTPDYLVSSLLGGSMTPIDVSGYGAISYYTASNTEDFGMEGGIALSTNYGGDNDPDLAKLIEAEGREYGGHTSTLEFTLTATGTLLNFGYVFASCEFNQGPQYNDIFGLFVSVNGSEYENIALLDNGRQITITNLRAGRDMQQLNKGTDTNIVSGKKYDYFTVRDACGLNMNGVTDLFMAQKAVNKGDKVKIKFAIADVGDSSVDSMVVIQAGSLSFDAPNTKTDYMDERITDFDPGCNYVITEKASDGTPVDTYNFTIDETGSIPLVGKDANGKDYDFVGKSLSVVKKGDGETTGDSDPQNVKISERPNVPDNPKATLDTPEDVKESDVLISENTIVVKAPQEGVQYSLDKTTWVTPDEYGYATFENLTPDQNYTIYGRRPATAYSLASGISEGTTVHTKKVETAVYLTDEEKESKTFVKNDWVDTIEYEGGDVFIASDGTVVITGKDETPHDLKVTDKAGNVTIYKDIKPFVTHRFTDYKTHPEDPTKLIAYCDDGDGAYDIIDKPAEGQEPEDPASGLDNAEKEVVPGEGELVVGIDTEEAPFETDVRGLSTTIAKAALADSGEFNIADMYTDKSNFKVWMEVTEIDEDTYYEEFDAPAYVLLAYVMQQVFTTEEELEGLNLGAAVDLSLYMSEDKPDWNSPRVERLHEVVSPLAFTFTLPEELKAPEGKIREYMLLTFHDPYDSDFIVDCTYDAKNNTLTAQSAKFSPYVILYTEKDAPNPPPAPTPPDGPTDPTPSGGGSNNVSVPATVALAKPAPVMYVGFMSPKTGDTRELIAYVMLLAVGLMLVFKRRNVHSE